MTAINTIVAFLTENGDTFKTTYDATPTKKGSIKCVLDTHTLDTIDVSKLYSSGNLNTDGYLFNFVNIKNRQSSPSDMVAFYIVLSDMDAVFINNEPHVLNNFI